MIRFLGWSFKAILNRFLGLSFNATLFSILRLVFLILLSFDFKAGLLRRLLLEFSVSFEKKKKVSTEQDLDAIDRLSSS